MKALIGRDMVIGASTLVAARADLSIPGVGNGASSSATEGDARFFDVVRQCRPDAIILDLREPYVKCF